MAPEVFVTERDSKAGDVDSYGMLLWQLGAREEPYATFVNLDSLVSHIAAGKQEKISEDTPQELREIIELCWLPAPNHLRQETTIQSSS